MNEDFEKELEELLNNLWEKFPPLTPEELEEIEYLNNIEDEVFDWWEEIEKQVDEEWAGIEPPTWEAWDDDPTLED